MNKQIYRQEALERMGSPEQLDQLMALTSPRAWFTLGGIGLILLFLIVWAVFGRITTTIEGDGVLVRLGGVLPVAAGREATVDEVCVQAGDEVQPGDVLARLLTAGTDGSRQIVPVASRIPGRVLNVGVFEGDLVDSQTLVAIVESTDYPLKAILYVSAGEGYGAQTGMIARIVPATSQKGNVRYLRGRVASAGKFPTTQNEIMYTLQNTEWANRVLSMGPNLQVVVQPADQPWSIDLYSGIPCHGWITTSSRPPISFVLPMPDSQPGD